MNTEMKPIYLLVGFFAIGKTYLQKQKENLIQEVDPFAITLNPIHDNSAIVNSVIRGAMSTNNHGKTMNLDILQPSKFYNIIKPYPKIIVYPTIDQKEEYLERMNGRDVINGEVFNMFYHFMKEGKHFDEILSAYERIEEDENTIKVVLKPGQYLSDVIDFDVERGFYLK